MKKTDKGTFYSVWENKDGHICHVGEHHGRQGRIFVNCQRILEDSYLHGGAANGFNLYTEVEFNELPLAMKTITA